MTFRNVSLTKWFFKYFETFADREALKITLALAKTYKIHGSWGSIPAFYSYNLLFLPLATLFLGLNHFPECLERVCVFFFDIHLSLLSSLSCNASYQENILL